MKDERKPSTKMKKAVNLIEMVTGLKPENESFKEYSKFIEEHISKLDGVDIRNYYKPSKKMLDAIARIEIEKNIRFNGSTMKEASEFLDEHLEIKEKKNDKRR